MNGLRREWSGKMIQIYTKQKYVRRIEGGGVFGGYDGWVGGGGYWRVMGGGSIRAYKFSNKELFCFWWILSSDQ